jgi:hypothetical protein
MKIPHRARRLDTKKKKEKREREINMSIRGISVSVKSDWQVGEENAVEGRGEETVLCWE